MDDAQRMRRNGKKKLTRRQLLILLYCVVREYESIFMSDNEVTDGKLLIEWPNTIKEARLAIKEG